METCPICGIGSPVEKYVDYDTQYLGKDGLVKQLIVPHVLVSYCASCQEQILGSTAVAQVEAAQRLARERLSPSELRAWRENLHKSQTELSATLGFGKKTYARWETGAYTLTAAADRYIRLVMASPENYACIEQLAGTTKALETGTQVDDLAAFNFSALTEEFESFFTADDPAIRYSEIFSYKLSQGSIF